MEQKLITGIISDLIDVCKMAKNSQGWSGSDPDENRWTIFYSLANKTAKTVQEVDIIGALQKIERDKNSLLVACKKPENVDIWITEAGLNARLTIAI